MNSIAERDLNQLILLHVLALFKAIVLFYFVFVQIPLMGKTREAIRQATKSKTVSNDEDLFVLAEFLIFQVM